MDDITLLLRSLSTTVRKYLTISKDEIPQAKENVRKCQHIRQMQNKQQAIEGVRTLYAQGNAIDKITYLTGHTTLTVKNYLKEDCSLSNGNYDCRRPGKLAPYEQTVIEIRSNGLTYNKIHKHICKNGYTGMIASLRMFMQKERIHFESVSKNENEPVEYSTQILLSAYL